jgi:hypothetical protein
VKSYFPVKLSDVESFLLKTKFRGKGKHIKFIMASGRPDMLGPFKTYWVMPGPRRRPIMPAWHDSLASQAGLAR